VDVDAGTVVKRASQTHVKNAASWREDQGLLALEECYHICPEHQGNPPVSSLGISVEDLKKPDQPKPKPKTFRTVFPSIEVLFSWLCALQNSILWHVGRAGSSGGSGKDTLTGDNGYGDIETMFGVETGQIPVCQSDLDSECAPCDHGHATEEECARIYSVLMGSITFSVGLLLHWMFAFLHVSVDRMTTLINHGKYANHYTKNDSPRGISEQKCLSNSVILTKDGSRPTVSRDKIGQCQDQTRLMGTDWADLTVLWKCRPRDPRGQPIKLGPRRYKVGEHTITRVYRNNKWSDLLYRLCIRYIDAVKKKVLPADLAKITLTTPNSDLPDVVILPLHWNQFILVIPDDLPDEPVGKDGFLIGKIHREVVKDYYYQKPLLVTMEALRTKSSKAIELDCVPTPGPLPPASQMRNPLYAQEMKQQPNRSYQDMIFDLCWNNKSSHFDPRTGDSTPNTAKADDATHRNTTDSTTTAQSQGSGTKRCRQDEDEKDTNISNNKKQKLPEDAISSSIPEIASMNDRARLGEDKHASVLLVNIDMPTPS